jgi:hypothetical protein
MNIVIRRPLLLSLPPQGGHPNRGAGLKNGKRGGRVHDARKAQPRAGGAVARPAGGRVDSTRRYPGKTRPHAGSDYPAGKLLP